MNSYFTKAAQRAKKAADGAIGVVEGVGKLGKNAIRIGALRNHQDKCAWAAQNCKGWIKLTNENKERMSKLGGKRRRRKKTRRKSKRRRK